MSALGAAAPPPGFELELKLKPATLQHTTADDHIRRWPWRAAGTGPRGRAALRELITPPEVEVTNTGPGFNRGSRGGARGCGFEERVGLHACTGGIHFL